VGSCRDQRRPLGLFPSLDQDTFQRLEIVHIIQLEDVPAIGSESGRNVFGECEVGVTLDGDAVVVPDPHQFAQAKVAGERRRLRCDSLHEVTVRTQHPGSMIHNLMVSSIELGRHMGFGDGHTHRRTAAGSQGPGGDLHPGRVIPLRVPGGSRAPLPEILDFVEAEIVAGEVEHAVQQRRGMAA